MFSHPNIRVVADFSRHVQQEAECCTLCATPFCVQAACKHTKTHMTCCGKPLCMGCLSKMCCMCRCQTDCEQVISVCCFCKQVSPVSAMELYFGLKGVKCLDCDQTA